MKKSKQAKPPELEDGADKISKLPDDVLQLILSNISTTEEVIRTSILSTRWRYLWTSVPSIDIDYARRLNLSQELDSNRFREFVYWVLLNKPLDVDSFRLWCADYYKMLTIRQWIHAAVMRKVKLLDLMFRPIEESEDIQLPHSLVTCDSLEVLKLCLLRSCVCLPKITGFQALRVLELREVYLFEEKLVDYFLESCPLLEDLSLIDCHASDYVISCSKLKKLRIHTQELNTVEDDKEEHFDSGNCLNLELCCPKLEFLKLTGYVAINFLFESLYSLKKAVIHAQDLFILEAPDFDFFATISHVECLSISVYCIGACFDPEVDDPISLPNLKTLEITLDGTNMQALIPFLKCLPDLEALHLIIPKHIYLVHTWNLEEAATTSILARHLKKVEFLEFDEEKTKLDIARALLEHGNLLEEMVFKWCDEAKLNERSMETMNQVSKFHKASSTVKLRCSVIDPSQIDSRPFQEILNIELFPV